MRLLSENLLRSTEEDDSLKDEKLKDCLIKAFMVIFTHDHSQHLLLNKDLIDIAFNCMEFCSEISLEAKDKLAKLISIIFKFPQVQEKLMSHEVILGINHLLELKGQPDILRNTVKACTYLSMNYEFVAKSHSLDVLKNLMTLMDDFDGNDKVNLTFIFANILKGTREKKEYFLQNKGVDFIFNTLRLSESSRLV